MTAANPGLPADRRAAAATLRLRRRSQSHTVIERSYKHPFYCLNPPAVQPDCEDIL